MDNDMYVHGYSERGAVRLHDQADTLDRFISTLTNEIRRRGAKRGVASLCVGGGMGIASLIEMA